MNSKLSITLCNTNDVSCLLSDLNPDKSPGPDHLPSRVIKKCPFEIAPTFCLLLNWSSFADEVQYPLKIANIVPVHKK